MSLRRTPLYERHADHDATFTDFGGWEMPVSFDSITTEHAAVREDVGVFDVSHMGEIEVGGPDAARLCQRLTTNNVLSLEPGDSHYSTVVDSEGIILDDILLYCLEPDRFLFVPNAGKDEWMSERWLDHRDEWDLDASVENRTESFGMLAVQGPNARITLEEAGVGVEDIGRGEIVRTEIAGVACWIAGTGYTGEDGCEIIAPWGNTSRIAAQIDATPCGLGCRDTLRLEMGYVLAGNEFEHETNPRTPIEARLDFVVDFDAEPPFVGRETLLDQYENGPDDLLVGFEMEERGVPRAGYDVTDTDGAVIGTVTSGTMSPTLGTPIGLGYVKADAAPAETSIGIAIRGEERKARIVTPPFVSTGR